MSENWEKRDSTEEWLLDEIDFVGDDVRRRVGFCGMMKEVEDMLALAFW